MTIDSFISHISIPLGIVAGLFASFIQSLGLTIQRKSHVINQQLPLHKQRVEHRRPLWLLGFVIFFSSNVLGSLVQIASLPVVILAPLGAVSLLWNAFFARLILGNVFSPWMIIGTILIAGGAILIAFFGIVPEPTRSLEDLLVLFRRPAFVAYFSILGVLVFICLFITHLWEYSLRRKLAAILPQTQPPAAINLSSNSPPLTTGVTDVVNGATVITERTPLLDGKSRSSSPIPPANFCTSAEDPSVIRTRLFIAVSFASFSGIISGMCLLFAKSGVELLLLTFAGKNQFWRWESWVLVLGLVVFALLQLWYMHKALVFADPTLVCPSAFCFYNLSSIVNGLVYFDQFSLIPPLHLGLVILGIFVLLGGVWVVSIQSGGGGVDIGTWNKEGEISDEESVVSSTDAVDAELENNGRRSSVDNVALGKTAIGRDPDRRRVGAIPIERSALSDSAVPSLSSSRSSLFNGNEPVHRSSSAVTTDQIPYPGQSGSAIGAHETSTALLRASQHRRRQTDARAPVIARTTSGTHTHSPSVSALGSGFQIGLSPVSPGFTIVPRERRRRVSGLGISGTVFGDVVGEAVDREREGAGGVRIRRRTVSEGAVNDSVEVESRAAVQRWRWLRGVLKDFVIN